MGQASHPDVPAWPIPEAKHVGVDFLGSGHAHAPDQHRLSAQFIIENVFKKREVFLRIGFHKINRIGPVLLITNWVKN